MILPESGGKAPTAGADFFSVNLGRKRGFRKSSGTSFFAPQFSQL